MKVLMLNGSPHKNGNTSLALKEMEDVFLAEGIETEGMAQHLKDFHVNSFQGYYYSKPIPFETFAEKYLS